MSGGRGNSWFPLYFKISCCWHPSLRMALSLGRGQEADCVDGTIPLPRLSPRPAQAFSKEHTQGVPDSSWATNLVCKVLFCFLQMSRLNSPLAQIHLDLSLFLQLSLPDVRELYHSCPCKQIRFSVLLLTAEKREPQTSGIPCYPSVGAKSKCMNDGSASTFPPNSADFKEVLLL